MAARNLLLYKPRDFKQLKQEKLDEYSSDIYSITGYVADFSLIDGFFSVDIIDISTLSEFTNRQSIAEQTLPRFDAAVEVICDEQKWEAISFDLRYLFDEIVHFDSGQDDVEDIKQQNRKSLNLRTLFFYDKDDFYALEEHQNAKGVNIRSISSFVYKNLNIHELDLAKDIIDISALSEFIHPQLITDEYIPQFADNTLFICDLGKREHLEHSLRFAFRKFSLIKDYELFLEDGSEGTTNRHLEKAGVKHRKITDLTKEELEVFMANFRKGLYGHPKFKDDFQEQIETFRVFNTLGENKILSLFLMGDSGVGKTQVAKLIFECLKGTKGLAKINFGNYSNEFSLSSLIGSARGYIGSEDGEIFIKVRNSDVGILLIDEFEKSNTTLFNYFLDVLESGKMTGSLGQELDLNGFIIVFTSNISKEDYAKRISPELRSRFDYKCMFSLLGNEDKMKYVEFRAKSIVEKLNPDADDEFRDAIVHLLKSSVRVSDYKNMRDINKQIKKVFVQYSQSR